MLLSCLSAGYGQTTYYVAASGNDANSGRSTDTPFQTLAKASSLSLQPGDALLFRRGDTFRGTLFVRQSGSANRPIMIGAYGSGNKPILAGSVPVTNWSNIGNNTWQANCPGCGDQVSGLYRNSSALPLGRYPNLSDANKGYLTVQSHNGKNQLTSQQSLTTDWTGAEVVNRPTLWIMDRALINQQSGNTLTFNNPGGYSPSNGWGFFIQNHPAALDQTGEWCYNPGNKTIRLYDNQNDPNGQQMTATAFGEGVNLTNASFITVHDLQITQTLTTGLLANNSSNLIFSNNDVTNSGSDGISVLGSGTNVFVENNLIEDANNNGFTIQAYQNFTFRGNTIRRVGVLPGRGTSGDGGYSGLQSLSNSNTLIESNVLNNIGYNGISVVTDATVRNNQVSNFCQTKSDGGGIYTWNGNRRPMGNVHIISNIIYNAIGTPEGAPNTSHTGANGIFLDDCSQNVEVANNTVFKSRGIGIFLRGALDITLKGNTTFDNSEEQLMLAFNNSCALRNNVIENNILFSRLPAQPVVAYESNANDLAQYGSFDRNYYARPFNDLFKISAVYNPGSGLTGATLSLAEWQARWGKDANSANSPITYPIQAVTQTGATVLDQSFGTNANGWSSYSPHGNGRTDWDNSNRLDGGSLRLSFASASNQANSYLVTWVNIGAVSRGKTYQLLFDGVASGTGKRVQVYPRQLAGGYQDLGARASFVLGTGREGYEATFTATADESNAILMVQVEEDGQTAWLDNLRLREATLTTLNPDDYIKLVYNPTPQEKTESLDGVYRDVRNNVYNRQVTIAPYASVVLLKEVNSTTPPPPPTTTLRNPENPANAVGGLDYQYYEGNWGALPDFNALTPARTGSVAGPDLSVRNREDNFALRYGGYISVPTDGVYTFYTSSDDGSKLFIGSTEVVNNDGGHAEQERSGSIGLKAGVHALSITYFEGLGGQTLTASYSGPGLGKQTIPANAFSRTSTTPPPPTPPTTTLRDPENPANAVGGLDYQYYEGYWNTLPDFNALTPAKTGSVAGPDLSVRNREDNFALRYGGYISVPTDGVYTFYTSSDDGSKLFIGSTEVVNNDGGHAEQERSGSIGLKAGVHALSITYFEGPGGQTLTASYSGPGLGKQSIPNAAYRRVAVGQPPTPPTTTLRDPENPANAVGGLDYQYYEGYWNTLPDFNTLTPAKTGSVASPDLSVRNRPEGFGLRYRGYLNIPTDGVYTFYTSSDDGSKFFIGSTEVVSNDGLHGLEEKSGTIGLKAGKHALTLLYMQAGGGQGLTVSYEGPGIGKQSTPTTAFFRSSTGGGGGGTGTGLRAEYFNNRELASPVALSRTDATVDFDWGTNSPALGTVNADDFSVRWTGQVEAPVSGNYTFSTTTDDGVRLWVNGTPLIDDWRDHAPTTNSGPSVALVAGQRYDIRMEYYERMSGAVAKLLWVYPGQEQQVIPQARLYPAAGGRLAANEFGAGVAEFRIVYPIPTYHEFTFVANDDVQTLRVIDMLGRDRLQFSDVRRGQSLPFGGQLPAGQYLLRVQYTNGTHRVEKLLKAGK